VLGGRVWIDEADILVGDSLISKVREGLEGMDYVGAILSPDALASRWVREELDIAMNQQISGRHVKVLRLCTAPMRLAWLSFGQAVSRYEHRRTVRGEPFRDCYAAS
jgi:hypothetical protein